jgi:hypothetical protein
VRDGGWLVIEDLHASFMREFGNPSPLSTHHFLSGLIGDLHRTHPRSSVAPRRPHLAHAVDYVVSATSWVGIRVRRHDSSDFDEVTAGTDDSLMDYDHRWDSSFGHSLSGRLPAPLLRVVRNRWTRQLDKLSDRRLFRSDAADD